MSKTKIPLASTKKGGLAHLSGCPAQQKTMKNDEQMQVEIDSMIAASEHLLRVEKGIVDTLQNTIDSAETTRQVVSGLCALRSTDALKQAHQMAKDALISCWSDARSACLRLYNASAALPKIRMEEVDLRSFEKGVGGKTGYENEVQVALLPHTIAVKVPLLWTRDLARRAASKGGPDTQERFHIFAQTVRQKVLDVGLYDIVDLEKFNEKSIQFLFVYNQNPNEKLCVIDNDNHLTKYVQDAVSTLLPSGDSALTTTHLQSAVMTKAIPSGSYMMIHAGRSAWWPELDILSFWAVENTKQQSIG